MSIIEPRKKDITDYILPIICVVIALYLSLHMAVVYDEMQKEPPEIVEITDESGKVIKKEEQKKEFDLIDFISRFSERISEKPNEIKLVKSTPKFFLGVAFLCLLIGSYIASTKKKFINNKEYGTSEWGTAKQIAHLQAKSIKREEIKNVKKQKIGKLKKNRKIKEINDKYTDNTNIIFTQTEKICMYNFELNNNTIIIGGSGSGKTRGYVLPNILNCCNSPYSPSLVVTDPKGEILGKIGKYLTEKCGYVIKVLNLKEQNRSFCFNPIKYIIAEKYEEQISSIVSSIMDSRGDNKEQKSNDPFWEDMAKVLLKAIFYAVYEGFPEEERNMSNIMLLFRWFEVTDNDDRYKNPTKLDTFFEKFGDKDGVYDVTSTIINFYETCIQEDGEVLKLFEKLPMQRKEIKEKIAIPLHSTRADGITKYKEQIISIKNTMAEQMSDNLRKCADKAINEIDKYIANRANNYENGGKPIGVKMYEQYGDVNTNPALRSWEDFRTKCKGKTAQSVTATALAKLSPFDEKEIRRIFSKDEMEIDLLGERRTALFVVLPPTNTTYNFIANVLYTTIFEQLEYCATVKHDQHLPVPVRFICDEFYNTGRIPKFENILSYARSFGIGISIILQSLDQIKEMYKDSWGTVLDNCSTFLYLGGIRHADTLEYISKLLGKGTFDKKSYSQTKGRQSSSTISYDKIGRELLDPSEIQRLNKKKCLLFVSGYQPYMSMKFNYKTHKNYKYTSDADKKNLFYYKTPQEQEEEKVKSNHSEEIKKIDIAKVKEEIRQEKEPTKVNIETKIGQMALNDNNAYQCFKKNNSEYEIADLETEKTEIEMTSEENDEYLKFLEMFTKEEKDNANISSMLKKSMEETLIDPKDNFVGFANIILEMVENKEQIEISSENDIEEVTEEEIQETVEQIQKNEVSEDEFETDDTEEKIDDISDSFNGLYEDMSQDEDFKDYMEECIDDSFMNQLNNIDISNMQAGEVREEDEEN